VDTGPVSGQVPIHLVTFEAVYGTRRFAKSRRIDDNEVVVFGDGLGQRKAQCPTIEEGNARRPDVMLIEVPDDVHPYPLVGKEAVANAENEGGTHEVSDLERTKLTKRLKYQIMCLGIPMQIKQIDGFNARCEAKGVERDVSLFMLQHEPLRDGDFVIVHVGYAIQKISPEEAATAWEVYDEMLAAESGQNA